MARQPDILILMADQLTPGALPAWGNTVARTPHIDRLAAEGVVFDAAYCNSPLCAPSRAVLMTGMLPSASGVYDNAADFSPQLPTWAHHLRLAGYRTVLAGKMHFCGPDQLHGFEERLTTDIYPADYGWTPDWTRPLERAEWFHSMSSVTEAGPCVRTNQVDFDEEVSFVARRRLFDLARQRAAGVEGAEAPFCMVVSLTHPHDPFVIPQEYWNRYDDAAIDMPRVPAEHVPDPHSARLRHINAIDATPVTQAQIRAARHAYYGACSFVDDHVGAMLETLRETGLDRDTIVLLLADHGEMLGERGLWYKMSFFEPSCRIPLIVHAPARFAPHRVSQAVSSADILPTLAALGGAPVPPETPIEGRSLVPHLEGTGGHDEVFAEYLAEGAVAPIVMIRRERWKFVHCPADPDQLYDLAADPDELHNLADDPAQAARVAALRQEVAARWDLPALDAAVLASQARRHIVNTALRRGAATSWDHQPRRDASREYIRSHMDLEMLEAMARFPRQGT